MAEKVLHVTRAQVAAAQLRVALDKSRGRQTDPTIVRIAEATPADQPKDEAAIEDAEQTPEAAVLTDLRALLDDRGRGAEELEKMMAAVAELTKRVTDDLASRSRHPLPPS